MTATINWFRACAARAARLGTAPALVVAAITTQACAHWTALRATSPAAALAGRAFHHVRVTLGDGRTLDLYNVTATADSVVGESVPGSPQSRTAVPCRDVALLAIETLDRARTARALWLGAYVVAGVAAGSRTHP